MLDEQYYIDLWNEKHCEFIKRGGKWRNEKMSDFLEGILLEAKQSYYDSGEVIMSDSVYDKYEGYLRILRPDSKFLKKVGF